MAKKWAKFPYADKAYAYDAATLKKHWARLHRGDCEPLPKDADVLEAWRHFHAGEFASTGPLFTAAPPAAGVLDQADCGAGRHVAMRADGPRTDAMVRMARHCAGERGCVRSLCADHAAAAQNL